MESCAIPPELQTEQLVAYLDGAAGVAVTQHLARCPYCHSRAMAMADEQKDLLSLFLQRSCPTTDELRDYHFDLLEATQTAAIMRHVQTCPHCTHDLFALREFIGEEAEAVETQPSPSLWEVMIERIRFLVADLIQGGGTALRPAYGVRGDNTTQNFIYQAGNVQIGLDIQPDVNQPGRKEIIGSIIGLKRADITVSLWRDDHLLSSAKVDSLNSFTFSALQTAIYELIIDGEVIKIHIPIVRV